MRLEDHSRNLTRLNKTMLHKWCNSWMSIHSGKDPYPHCNLLYKTLGKWIYSQLGNMHWKVDEHLKYLINFSKRKYSLEI